MAKKKQPKKKAMTNPVGRPKSERGARFHAFAIKAYPEWKEWLEDFRHHRKDMTIANVIDAALRLLARAEKFRDPPER